MPTICEIAGAPVPENIDGISFLPTLIGNKQTSHDYLYWEFNENIHLEKTQYKQAIRKGKWKGVYYILEDEFELYDLSVDVMESKNLVNDHPELVGEIKRLMMEAHESSEIFPLTLDELKVAGKI